MKPAPSLAEFGEILPQSRSLPSVLSDYYELTKPRMNFLVIVTTAVGYYIAAKSSGASIASWLLVHAILGTTLTAASASVFNQLIERRFDALMPRTRNRPLAANRLGITESSIFGVLLGIAGVAWLAIAVNPITASLGAFTLLCYVLLYTPLKRQTPWCTLVGAIPGAVPPMMGVTALSGHLTPLAWSLFAILFVWQLPHFFALALMYRRDYEAGGFRMLPSEHNGELRTHRQILLFTIALLPVSLLPIYCSHAGWSYGVMAMVLGAGFLVFAIRCVRSKQRSDARRLFLFSIIHLPLLLAALMIDQ